ncbi:hypothetical protein [Aequorivita sp. Q41]|uniref:hypothetical protein n=1 Tax=Aequorivita sp. Q41 TaxID=3153300 RepID=UPI0032423B50
MNIYQHLLEFFNETPFLIKFAIIVVVVMVITIIVLIISLKMIRSLLNIKDKEILGYKKEYEALVVEYLFSEAQTGELSDKQHSIILKIKEDIKVIPRRKSVITVLSSLMNEVSGEMSDAIQTLYHKTGLISYAKVRLKSKKWHLVAKAIGELRRFKIHEVQDEVSKYINHPRVEVRKEAQLYLVHLFKFKGLNFLDDLELPLSEWHQLQLLEALLNLEDQKICDIKPWLKSANISVVLFALKLVKVYNQFELKDTLVELLSHPEKEVKLYASVVLNKLFGYEVAASLKPNYIN